ARGRAVRCHAARDGPAEAARGDAQIRGLCARRAGAHGLGDVVASGRAVPLLSEGLQDRPDALHQPGPREALARSLAGERPPIMEKAGLTTEVNRFQFEMLLSLMPGGVIRVPSPTAFGAVESRKRRSTGWMKSWHLHASLKDTQV